MLLSFFIPAALTFAAGVILSDTHNFTVKRYEIESDKVRKNVRFLQISDLHGMNYGPANQKLVAAVKRLKPDFVLMTGDIMSAKELGKSIPDTVDTAERLIRDISADFPVYFALGNHEQRVKWRPEIFDFSYEDMMKRFMDAGAVILDNSSVIRYEGIGIYGFSLEKEHYLKTKKIKPADGFLNRALGNRSRSCYNILLAHDPEFAEIYAAWNPDLILSGHYHGGVARLPLLGGMISPKFRPFPKYSGGRYKVKDSDMIVSCGLGMHTIHLRFNNPGELVCIDLRKKTEIGKE
ncbi:MAG: metallophosphoesterase [Lachnospiraceae bacterium]|nr:metallophosphoesterase [Lachnospiraceae bacterium]